MPTEIVSGVHDVTVKAAGDRRLRAYLFEHDVPTLVDTGLPATTGTLFDGLAALPAPERVVITHGDPDHVGGLPAVVDRYDPAVFLPAGRDHGYDGPATTYGDGDAVGAFEAVHLPGHAPDNHALVDADRGVVVAGDAVSGADQRGLPAGYPVLPPAVFSEDLNRAEASLERLLDHEFSVLLTFHGSSITEAADAKLRRFVEFPGRPD